MMGLSLRLWHDRRLAPVEGWGAQAERGRAPVRSFSIPLLSRSQVAQSRFGEKSGECESRPSVSARRRVSSPQEREGAARKSRP